MKKTYSESHNNPIEFFIKSEASLSEYQFIINDKLLATPDNILFLFEKRKYHGNEAKEVKIKTVNFIPRKVSLTKSVINVIRINVRGGSGYFNLPYCNIQRTWIA